MPLYIEILDHDLSAADSAIQEASPLGVVSTWRSETTGELVRLVDAPDEPESPRATVRSARILFY